MATKEKNGKTYNSSSKQDTIEGHKQTLMSLLTRPGHWKKRSFKAFNAVVRMYRERIVYIQTGKY